MELKKSKRLDDVIKLLRTFARDTMGLELELNGSENELDSIAGSLSVLAEKISIARQTSGTEWEKQNLESDLVSKLLDTAPDGMVAINEQGTIVLFNRQAEALFGYRREEIIGKWLEVLIPGHYHRSHKKFVGSYFSKPATRAMGGTKNELIGKRKNGEEFPVDVSISYLDTATGRIAISAIRDITEGKKLSEEIQRSERKLKEITAAVPGIVYQCTIDTNGKLEFTFLSDGAKAVLGITPEDAYKNSRLPFSRIHPEDLPHTLAAISDANSKGIKFFHSFRIVTDDGGLKWLQVSDDPKREANGTITRTGCILDITQSKMADKMLEESEAFNRSVLASLTSQVAVINNNGIIIATNKAWDDFSKNNEDICLPRAKKWTNFFALCRDASEKGDANAGNALIAMQAVLHKEKELLELQYSFEQGGERKWFTLRITTFYGDSPRIVLAHTDITGIKKAEQWVRESKDKYQIILETTDEMINTVGTDGKILWANNAWKRNLQYNDEEVRSLSISDIFSEETRDGFDERIRRIKAGETIGELSATIRAKDGTPLYVRGTVVPIFEDGKYAGTQGFFRNVSEIKKERAERIKAETRLQRTLDTMVVGCMVISFKWIYLYVNDAAAEQVLQKPGNLIGRTMLEVYPGVEHSSVLGMYKRCMEERIRLEFEEQYVFHNGATKWFEFKVEPADEGIFVMSLDITERKEAEQKINRNQELLGESQRIAHLGSWDLDVVNNVLFWSDEVYRIFEIDPKSFGASYQAFLDLVHPDDREEVNRCYRESLANKTPYDALHRIKFPDGRIKYLHEQAETVYNAKGIPIRTVGTVHDITERKEAEQILEAQNMELKKINSELDRFVYSTSHDLRAPLLSLLGLIDLSQNSADAKEMSQYFQMMQKSIHRIDDTIKEILVYSRNSRMQLTFEQLDVTTIVNNLIENIKHINGAENIRFTVNVDDKVHFFSDKLRVIPIIDNLVTNAVKYQREGEVNPYVTFTFIATDESGVFIIEDNGEGIAEDKLDRIFEMFYRNSERSVGSGLGLYICKEIVSKMGGTLTVKSELGEGEYLYYPVTQSPVAELGMIG